MRPYLCEEAGRVGLAWDTCRRYSRAECRTKSSRIPRRCLIKRVLWLGLDVCDKSGAPARRYIVGYSRGEYVQVPINRLFSSGHVRICLLHSRRDFLLACCSAHNVLACSRRGGSGVRFLRTGMMPRSSSPSRNPSRIALPKEQKCSGISTKPKDKRWGAEWMNVRSKDDLSLANSASPRRGQSSAKTYCKTSSRW
ncbi:hypothetical protein P154DRAFT_348270 [Amniculicola lignicola CBS 123094]|uniref:Uncharacterized protein n=1 Tax=Amniculicola lignicola CBS 123094 TaxID=1392246 RepID=A0A6A5W0U1_9PLEO|nr:hypothetical protein P154DRAFT_348270 [Amniculicola lignicola CBS 123094]